MKEESHIKNPPQGSNVLEWSPLLAWLKEIQVGSKRKDMEECTMFIENIINLTCCTNGYHYQNASIQGIQIPCRKDQMQGSHVNNYIVEKSSTFPGSQSIRSLKPSIGLDLSTPARPGLVIIIKKKF